MDIKNVIKCIIFSEQNSGKINKYVYYIKFISKCAKRLENIVLQYHPITCKTPPCRIYFFFFDIRMTLFFTSSSLFLSEKISCAIINSLESSIDLCKKSGVSTVFIVHRSPNMTCIPVKISLSICHHPNIESIEGEIFHTNS